MKNYCKVETKVLQAVENPPHPGDLGPPRLMAALIWPQWLSVITCTGMKLSIIPPLSAAYPGLGRSGSRLRKITGSPGVLLSANILQFFLRDPGARDQTAGRVRAKGIFLVSEGDPGTVNKKNCLYHRTPRY